MASSRCIWTRPFKLLPGGLSRERYRRMLEHSEILASTDADHAFESMRRRNPSLRAFAPIAVDDMMLWTHGLAIGTGFLSLTRTTGYSVSGPTGDKLVISLPLQGGQGLSTEPDATFTAEAPVVVFPQDEFRSELHRGFVGLTYVQARAQLAQLAEESDIRLPDELRTGGVLQLETRDLFRRIVLAHAELVSRIAPDQPKAQTRYRYINEALQLAFLASIDQEPERSKPYSHYTKLALSHLRMTPVFRVGDLAKAANCSVRTLQYALQRDLGMSANDLIVEQRLQAVRSALQARVDGQSITQIAAAAGYASLGRFSAQYRNRFGELPSQTQPLKKSE